MRREIVPLEAGSNDVQTKLLKSVAQCAATGDLSNIASNVFGACLHLSYLMSQNFRPHEVPELADDFQSLTSSRIR